MHFEHHEVGYAYRLSNLLAAVATAQLDRLGAISERTRAINARYRAIFDMLPGVSLIDIDRDGRGNGWLTVVELDQSRHPTPTQICQMMAVDNIEARPAWKPMHLQKAHEGAVMIGGAASEHHFRSGVCLPSGSAMTSADQERVISSFLSALAPTRPPIAGRVIDLNPGLDVRTEQPQPRLDSPAPNPRAA